MRHVLVFAAAVLLLTPAVTAGQAHHSNAAQHQEFAMAKKKKKAPKAKVRPKKEEYMRAVPSR
jgi:hypothetical protein